MGAPGFSRRPDLDSIGSAQRGSRLAALVEVETLEDALSSDVALPRFRTSLITCFGFIALLLAVVGVYGVVSFSVGQRFHKFGVRMALGADGPAILAQVLRDGASIVLAGVVLGLGGAFALSRVLESMLFGVGARTWASSPPFL